MFKRVIWISVFLGWFTSPFAVLESPSFIPSIGIATALADGDADKDKADKHDENKRHEDDDDESANNDSENKDGETAGGVTVIPALPAPVADTTPPLVVPPLNIMLEASGPLTSVVLGAATVTDNVNIGLIAIPSSAGAFAPGVNTVTWRATDAAGNIGTATQTVTITDTMPPRISIQQPAITIEATSAQSVVNLGLVTAADLVSGTLTPTNNAPATFPLGVTQVVWTAVDAAGNTVSATQNVVVQDTTPPVISAPAAVTADSTTGQPMAVNVGTATATDAFAPVGITNNAPASFPLGATTVIWTATDANGNAATTTQLVTVNNATPVAGLPPDPGPAGKLTLAGVDSDNDGVRDDVQRWIALTYPNSQKARAALTQMSKDYQSMLLTANDKQLVYNAALQLDKTLQCLMYIYPNLDTGEADRYSDQLEAIVMNTALRSRAYIQASRNLSGRVFTSLGYGNYLQGCKFNPNAMPN